VVYLSIERLAGYSPVFKTLRVGALGGAMIVEDELEAGHHTVALDTSLMETQGVLCAIYSKDPGGDPAGGTQERGHGFPVEQRARREQLLLDRCEELQRANLDLIDANRRIKSLHAELSDTVRQLKDTDAIKTRFWLNMNHEMRSPINSILALTTLLLRRVDGALSDEQGKLVEYIRKAAESLSVLANDSLDAARAETGDIKARPAHFEAAELLGTLRGMLPQSLVGPTVRLVVEEPKDIPALYSDQGKVSQILRNFINNALKFTERGEVRVSARYDRENDMVYYAVRDTGVGIAPDDQKKIFEDLAGSEARTQVDRGRTGTGLGLPLCRKLAAQLEGRITLESKPGVGSKFMLALPRRLSAGAGDTSDAGHSACLQQVNSPAVTPAAPQS
jgi:signal transduction histidine kinase